MNQDSRIKNYIRSGKHSETLLINQLSLARADNNQTVYKFGFGQSPFPVPEHITATLANAAHRKEYMSVQGHPPLRNAICEFHKKHEQKDWNPERIIVGTGSKILLFCVMAAFEKAELLLPAPSWVSYDPQGKLAGHPVNWLTTNYDDRWRLTPEQLDHYCQSRNDPNIPLLLVLNYPSNPTGQTYSPEELSALSIIMKKHNVIVIADEIYSLLSFSNDTGSIADYYPEGCIVSSGISKWCGAGGWRLGFIHVPEQLGKKLFQAIIGVASETYSCASSPIQIAATEAYSDNKVVNQFLAEQTNLLEKISVHCANELTIAEVNVHASEGGFYLFPDFCNYKDELSSRGIDTSEQLTAALMEETGVALLPGSAFGMPPSYLTTRLAFVDFDGAQILEQESAPDFDKVKEGIARIVGWLVEL